MDTPRPRQMCEMLGPCHPPRGVGGADLWGMATWEHEGTEGGGGSAAASATGLGAGLTKAHSEGRGSERVCGDASDWEPEREHEPPAGVGPAQMGAHTSCRRAQRVQWREGGHRATSPGPSDRRVTGVSSIRGAGHTRHKPSTALSAPIGPVAVSPP